MLDQKAKYAISKQFESVKNPVKLVVFTQKDECHYCKELRLLAEETATASPFISTEVHDFQEDTDAVERFKIDKIPAMAVVGAEDYGIRFYGLPGGYEFTALVEAVKMVGGEGLSVSTDSEDMLRDLKKQVDIQVFVTPT